MRAYEWSRVYFAVEIAGGIGLKAVVGHPAVNALTLLMVLAKSAHFRLLKYLLFI